MAQSLIAGAVDFVVFIAKNRRLGGRRCVTTVLEVAGAPDGRVASAPIFKPSAVDGRAVRDAGRGDHRRTAASELTDAGYDDDAASYSYRRRGPRVTAAVWLPVLLGAGIGAGLLLVLIGAPRGAGGPDPAAVPVARAVAAAAVPGAGRPVAGSGRGGRGGVGGDRVAGRPPPGWPRWCCCWPKLFGGGAAEQRQIAALEALVVWTESLRDTIAAHASLEHAIPASTVNASAADPAGAGPAGRADPGPGADGPGAAEPGRRTGRPVRGPGDRRADPEHPTPRGPAR